MGAPKVGIYAGRVLEGERPADMPIEQVTRTGLTPGPQNGEGAWDRIFSRLLASADEVIE
jgi:putative tryptophan/tyrosine transport system substrate-binding protein